MSNKTQSFEASLDKLEEIVRKLEDGELSLDDSLKLFEEGIRLSRECKERLDQAEKRIEVLTKDESGNAALREMELSDDGGGSVGRRGAVSAADDDDESF